MPSQDPEKPWVFSLENKRPSFYGAAISHGVSYNMPIPAYSPTDVEQVVAEPSPREILVVDDDPMIVNLLKENLEMEGYKVHCAYEGQAALRMAHAYPVNLVILDVNMPMTNGLKVLEYLRSSHDTEKIPVIFVSGEASKDVYPIVEHTPRVAHVKKPLDLESFNSLVKHFLDQYPNH